MAEMPKISLPEQFLSLTPNIHSGSSPNHSQLLVLAEMGIQTIISVDGPPPPEKYSHLEQINYIHIPVGYSTITDQQLSDIISAIRLSQELKTGVYIHCHHGKHRAPVAISAALRSMNMIDLETSLDHVKKSGLADRYKGLKQAIHDAVPGKSLPSPRKLRKAYPPEDIIENMSHIDKLFKKLKSANKQNWPVTPDSNHEEIALLLEEKIRELKRIQHDYIHEEFETLRLHSETSSKKLTLALQAKDYTAAQKNIQALSTSCKSCHAEFRD